jgi:DNA-binding beta-propeller fold protein YncE
MGLAVGLGGKIYVADCYNNAVRCISADGLVSTLAGMPGRLLWADGLQQVARCAAPRGLAVAPDGSLLVADGNRVRSIT